MRIFKVIIEDSDVDALLRVIKNAEEDGEFQSPFTIRMVDTNNTPRPVYDGTNEDECEAWDNRH
jgi:hypothetical protein